MNTTRATLLMLSLSLTMSGALLAGTAQAAAPSGGAADFGSLVAASAATRVITLTPATRYVNVDDGETVRFVSGTQNFTWHFDTYPGVTSVNLSTLAPAAAALHGVRVYVGGNPLYQG